MLLKITYIKIFIDFVLILLVPAYPGNTQTIVFPDGSTQQEKLAAWEVLRYVYLRTDQRLPLQNEGIEYYVEGTTDDGKLVYPATAPMMNHTVFLN